ncbi:endogenous retrovirus group K member 6 Env polyprotein [Hyaena hyaena]|uniref:endogenous retrovirus group K member 6 Env polyprotein n=1 Tax=Hyaena hyaena TaxID=95912 RepID=UPI001920D45D|nr:endogenous retrovirus group K member 6 Env polyprotein [Hyaena hyaena]
MAVITCQVMYAQAIERTYWAYVPNPPLVRAISWGEPEVQVCTNETAFFPPPVCGGIEHLYHHINQYSISNVTVAVEGLPLNIGGHPFCLSTRKHNHYSYNTWGVTYNNYHPAVFTVLISTRGFNTSTTPMSHHPDTFIPFCSSNFFIPSLDSLEWESCRGYRPFKVMNYSGFVIVDWSPDHGQLLEKWSNKTLKWYRINGTLMGNGNETVKRQQFALVSPQLQLLGYPHFQGKIWKLWAVSGNLTIWSGNYTLNMTDSSGPFHVNLHVNKSYSATACIKYLFALSYEKWTWNATEGSISCNDCNLTQCVNQSWWKIFETQTNNSDFSLVVVKTQTEVWLPVNLTRPWSDSFAVSHLVAAVETLLHRSRRMLGVIIASVLAVAAITATAAVAGLALHQGIQTADFVREWHKDFHLLWQQQRDLDTQLATDVLNLQHTVSWLGDQLTVLSTRSMLKCDWNSPQLCITPVSFNMSEGWEKVKRSLAGHQNLTKEIMELELQILSTFSKTLPDITGSGLLKGLQEGMNNLNSLGHVSTLIGTTFRNTLLIILLCCVIIVVFWCWRRRQQLKKDRQRICAALQLATASQKKGGDVGAQQ